MADIFLKNRRKPESYCGHIRNLPALPTGQAGGRQEIAKALGVPVGELFK